MKRIVCGVVVLFGAVAVQAAQSSCDDHLAHVLNVGVPRTSMNEESATKLPQTLAQLVEPMYADPCGKGKSLQINLAFGSDYEVLDWLERGSVDGGIVPDLSLWLLEHDENPLRELSPDRSSQLEILQPRVPSPVCKRFVGGRWTDCAADANYNALLDDIAAGKDAGTRRVMFASHLSSTGFLDPIAKAQARFADDETQWQKLFDAAHFTIDTDPAVNPFALALKEEAQPPKDLTVIFFPGEEVLARGPTPIGAPKSYREHLVISSSASAFFKSIAFASPYEGKRTILPPELERLLAMEHPPRPLEVIAQGDPESGVRSYAFTIHESLRLLAQQQRSSGQSDLALVLPGGGVKAAYQSKIVDHLYGNGYLRNTGLPKKDGPLEVRSVLGTSGGALLGYFVAQLGEKGPFNLSDILWRPDGRTLESHDVFAATDMLRYISIVWTFMIFCILLALATGRFTSPFYGRSPTPHGAWRWRLMTLLIVFFAVPILIRYVTGGDDVEHVPVIEGVFYSLLTVLVMFCDQCLVYSRDQVTETRSLGVHIALFGGLGGAFVFASLFGAKALQEPVSIGFAFATMSIIFLGSPLLLLYASGRFGDARRRLTDMLLSLVVVLILCAFGVPAILPLSVRYLFAFLILLGLAVFAYWYANLPKRNMYVASAMTFLTLFATAALCWPGTPVPGPGLQFINTPAMETTNLAPFLASTGCLLIVIAVMMWVYQRREYSLRGGQDFSLGLALLVVHAMITSTVVVIVARARPGWVHNIEMTPSFWIALTLIGGVLALLALSIAPRWSMLRRAVGFLTSEHPNGSLLPRRYARMLAVTTLSLIWWNAMVAPGLYGNDAARKYLKRAVANFDAKFAEAAGQRKSANARGFIPTAKFVAPTNTLDDKDATRYFLFLTENNPPIDLPRRIAGAEWKVYATRSASAGQRNCRKVVDPRCAEFVQDVIFSSGSPFPIFAAHRVQMPGEGEKIGLIDGGYSNNFPIDAARTIAARQVLVVHSAPVVEEAHEHGEDSALSLSPGMLIRNAGRLPSFMFELGQQTDRLSRQNLFVIGFAPIISEDESWPGLAQFDAPTVEAMLAKAKQHLHERIGSTESWGEPRFRFSQQIAGGSTKADL